MLLHHIFLRAGDRPDNAHCSVTKRTNNDVAGLLLVLHVDGTINFLDHFGNCISELLGADGRLDANAPEHVVTLFIERVNEWLIFKRNFDQDFNRLKS